MRLNISKLIISKLIIVVLLILTGLGIGIKAVNAQSYVYFEGDVGSVVAFQSPSAEGCVFNEATNSDFLEPLWIKWTDQNGSGNTRYTLKPRGQACYTFPSWQAIGEDGRNRDFYTYIKPAQPDVNSVHDTDRPGDYYFIQGYVRKASTANSQGFGCVENSHVITAVLPTGTPGSFTSGVAGNIDVNNDLITQSFPDIKYKAPTGIPKNLTAVCPAPGTTANLSWQPPDNTAGYSYQIRVDKDPDSWGGRSTINPGDVLNDNASSPYSFSSEPGKNYKWWLHACRFGSCSDAEYNNFSCGSCPPAPSSQTPRNGETLACTATAVDLSWTGPAGSLYNIRVDGEGASAANNTPNNCTPHTICINGYTEEKIKINIQSGKTYTWWVDIQAPNTCGYLTTGTKTFSTASCSPPTLGDMKIKEDANANPAGVADGPYGVSGLRSSEGGSNYYNSLEIIQNVTLPSGTSADNIALIGIGFGSTTPPSNSLASLVSSANSNNGFIILYANKDTSVDSYSFQQGKYYVYTPQSGWSLPFKSGFINYTPLNSGITVLTASSVNNDPALNPKFTVQLNSSVGSRTWGTYGYLLHTTNNITTQSVVDKTPSR